MPTYLERARAAIHALFGGRSAGDPSGAPAPTGTASGPWAWPGFFADAAARPGAVSQEALASIARSSGPHAILAVQRLVELVDDPTLSGERFGTMLGELSSPDLLALALLLHHVGASPRDHQVAEAVRRADTVTAPLDLGSDARHMLHFLIENQRQMSQIAFRQDTGDADVINTFASLVKRAAVLNSISTEEHLKMLTLLTVADLSAIGTDTFTPWKAELLWRLFVDTYNQLTMGYGDDVIDSHDAARTALHGGRPADISEAELTQFLDGFPTRYLTLFDASGIYEHVRLWRNMTPDDVHFFLKQTGEVWELTVVTLDKPYLFSNISGVLSYLDMDILQGQALTSRSGLVLDVFQFTDPRGRFEGASLDPLLSDAVAGRANIEDLLKEKARTLKPAEAAAGAAVLHFDNDTSQRYTVLELVADDAPGLLHRVSRAISAYGCVVDLVLISTEGHKAIDVFHMRKDGGKLSDSDQLALTEHLERQVLTGSA